MSTKISPVSEVISNTASDIQSELSAAGGDIASQAKDVAAQARDALSQMQKILADFAVNSGQSIGDAGEVAKSAAAASSDMLGNMANDIKANGEESLETLATAVARNPLMAVVAAAGVGLVLGLFSRSGSR